MKKLILLLLCGVLMSNTISLYAQPAFTVEVKGKGSPVLLFPGFGCPGAVWQETVAQLSQTHECHVFTFAGFGQASPIGFPWLSTIKDSILQYVKARQLQRPVLLGHSLGGTLSLWLAALEKTTFQQAIVVDALPCTMALFNPAYKGELLPYDNPQSKAMLEMNAQQFDAMLAQQVNFMCRNKDKQAQILNWMKTSDRKTYVYGYTDYLNLDLREAIAGITIPVTLLAATAMGKAMVEKTYQLQYQKLPSVKIRYADNAAHFVMFDQPEWFAGQLKEILQ